MVKIKICGLRRKEDIEIVNKYKPEYIGFIFAKSKREVSKEEAKELIKHLDKNIKKVGIFVNSDIEKVNEISNFCDLDIVQLHGDENNEYIGQIDLNVWKAIRIKNKSDFEKINQYSNCRILLDSFSLNAYGGNNTSFDWKLLSGISSDELVIAGGINEDNIEKLLTKYTPYVVDISSSVEIGGFKDDIKVKNIIKKVRNYNEIT